LRNILEQSNESLLYEIKRLRMVLGNAASFIPKELDRYYAWAIAACDELYQRVKQNIQYLNLGRDDIIPDILSNTQDITRFFHLFDQRLATPVLRVRPSDRLCLRLLCWLHSEHPHTKDTPAGLSDGGVGVLPALSLPAIYFMPSSAQHDLLYLPLFFHEFGHLLYVYHEQEMKDLIRSLQGQIGEKLKPSIQRDDPYAQVTEEAERKTIEETWYLWAQELFCDAVGYVIGGTAFAHAFSMYFRMRGQSEYYEPQRNLGYRSHPVSWLRVRVFADRARRMGYTTDSKSLEDEWDTIAREMGIIEDYYGFYELDFLPLIQQTIDDMLTEASPRRFTDQEVAASEVDSPSLSPVHLLNQAWERFWADPRRYRAWEERAIRDFLGSDIPDF
jgi:hypothetical protein